MGRKRNVAARSFTGCWICRTRKVKCDETKPSCLACQRIGIACSGYEPRYIWIRDGDHGAQTSGSTGRQVLKSASTWAGRPTLSPDLLEFLIQQCDGDDELNGNPVATRMVSKPSHNPFSVFAIHHPRKGSMLAELLDLQGLNDSIPPSLSFGPKTTATDCALLQHYVNHVALLMMPYKDSRNPWIHYPMTALRGSSSNQPALYHGLLAQSAFNIAQLHNDPSMMETGLKHYDLAIKELSLCLATARRHQCQFSAMLATIMTLLFAEIYSGQPKRWRYHFRGAWNHFQKNFCSDQWKPTDFVCGSVQSLYIIKIIGDTTWIPEDEGQSRAYDVALSTSLPSISSTANFGFTIGASRPVLECIHRITKFSKDRQCANTDEDINPVLQEVLQCLNVSLQEETKTLDTMTEFQSASASSELIAPEQTFQRTAFIYATYIYLYRTLLDVPPHVVKKYVAKTFENVMQYFEKGGANFSIWPAFIAAVEAYEEEDKTQAGLWLDWATSFGLGSRILVRKVVEEVWRRREEIAEDQGISLGTVIVDWRKIMYELGCDVLLV